MIQEFSGNYVSAVEGRGPRDKKSAEEHVEPGVLHGGARIAHIFDSVYGRTLRRVDPFQNITLADVRMCIANANGHRPSLFVPEKAFEALGKFAVAWRRCAAQLRVVVARAAP